MKPATKKILIALGFLPLIVIGEALGAVFAWGQDTTMQLGAMLGRAVVLLVAITVLGGVRELIPTKKGLRITWGTYGWILITSVIACMWDTASYLLEQQTLAEGGVAQAGFFAVIMLLVGIGEELLYRGLVFGVALARFGSTKRGVMACALVSSVVFGLAHIDFFTLNPANPLELAQAFFKVIQTGIVGLALAASVARGGGLFWPSMFHALEDYLLFLPMALFTPDLANLEVEYVATGEDGLLVLAVYVVMCALYLPAAIRAIKMLRAAEIPCLGPFMPSGGTTVVSVVAEEADTQNNDRPPLPSGLQRNE